MQLLDMLPIEEFKSRTIPIGIGMASFAMKGLPHRHRRRKNRHRRE